MRLFSIILSEIWHRKLNFLLGLFAIITAVTIYVSLMTMSRACDNETKRLMRDLGFNILILPKETNIYDFWTTDIPQGEMPEEYVYRLAESEKITADHYVGILQHKISLHGKQALLTGWLQEVPAKGKREKSPMGYQIPTGKVYLGYELSQRLNIHRNEKIDILDKQLQVDAILAETGSKDDICIYAHLHDVQEMLNKLGKINMIKALKCLCRGGMGIDDLRKVVADILPGTKVIESSTIALVREKTRQMVEKYGGFIFLVTLVCSAIFIFALSFVNVLDRRSEIGILKALGVDSQKVALLFLVRASVLGVVGAFFGFFIGTYLALHFGPQIFKITATAIKPIYELFITCVIGAPVITIIASLVPTIVAATMDPAVILREE